MNSNYVAGDDTVNMNLERATCLRRHVSVDNLTYMYPDTIARPEHVSGRHMCPGVSASNVSLSVLCSNSAGSYGN